MTQKTAHEIEIMREAGHILASIMDQVYSMVAVGVDVYDLERKFIELCDKNNVNPSCKGYAPHGLPPFPTGLCVSINSQSVHCFPQQGTILKNNDVVTIDTVIEHSGYHADMCKAFVVGGGNESIKLFVKTAEETLYKAIQKVKHNAKVGIISETIQKSIESAGYNVLTDYAGHGIGKEMHEYPNIPCYGNRRQGPKLKEGMTICIEVLATQGDSTLVNTSPWQTKTKDGKLFCQFEHTVLVTKNGAEILTSAKS